MVTSSRVFLSAAALACLLMTGLRQPVPPTPPAPGPSAPGVLLTPAAPQPPDQAIPRLTAAELDELLGPIALYPDPLIAQMLPAATYPLEIVQAARWVREHPNLQGVDEQNWDPSVRAIAHYPTVIRMMDEKLDWTIRLGQAFLNQQQDVMDSVQQLRVKARTVGTLRDTPQQQVIVEQEVVRIVPAQPDVIYVPVYSPQVVYYEPIGLVPTPYITFGIGFTLGWWLDLDCDWHHRHVYYHYWRPRHYNGDPFPHGPGYPHYRPEVARPGREGEVWRHDPHRMPSAVGRPPRPISAAPSNTARGRPTPVQPRPAAPGRPGGAPGQVRPMPGPAQAPGARPGPAPGARPGTPPPRRGPVTTPTPRQVQPTQPPRRAPNALGGYQRGTQTQQNSQRGQSSRAVGPAAPSPRPAATPRPAPRPPTTGRPMPGPRPSSGALGGYGSGQSTRANSQRGAASRGRGPR